MTEALQQEIRTLRSLFNSDRDPDGRVFAPLADAYRRSGELQEAVRLLNEGLTRLPDFVPGHVVAAQLYVEQGLAEEAEIAARRALELDSENVSALGSLLRVLDERGDAEAEEVRARLVSLDPGAAPEPGAALAAPALTELAEVDTSGAASALVEPEEEPVFEVEVSESEVEVSGLEVEVREPEVDTLEMPALAPEPAADEHEDLVLADAAAETPPTETDVMDFAPGVGGDFDRVLATEPPTPEGDASTEEPVFDLDALAPVPDDGGADVVDLDDLAPVEDEVSTEALSSDAAAGEPVFDLDALAPAPEGEAEEPVLDMASLAPDTEAMAEEPVFDMDALAPDAEAMAEEPVFDVSALAPEQEPSTEEPVFDMDALAPDAEVAAEEPVFDMASLAPDTDVVAEEPVLDMASLAPDVEVAAEEPVVDMASLAPEAEPIVDMDALAPTPETAAAAEEVVELEALAPDVPPAAEEPVIDLDALAPDAEELAIELDTLAPEPEPTPEQPEATSEPETEPAAEPEVEPAGASPSKSDEPLPGDDEPGEPVYTRTLASLYETQGAVSEALRVLRRLQAADPDDADLARRIEELEDRLASMDVGEAKVQRPAVAEGEVAEVEEEEEEVETLARDLAQSGEGEHDVDSPFAWGEREQEEEQGGAGPTVREYFEDLLTWEPDEES